MRVHSIKETLLSGKQKTVLLLVNIMENYLRDKLDNVFYYSHSSGSKKVLRAVSLNQYSLGRTSSTKESTIFYE